MDEGEKDRGEEAGGGGGGGAEAEEQGGGGMGSVVGLSGAAMDAVDAVDGEEAGL